MRITMTMTRRRMTTTMTAMSLLRADASRQTKIQLRTSLWRHCANCPSMPIQRMYHHHHHCCCASTAPRRISQTTHGSARATRRPCPETGHTRYQRWRAREKRGPPPHTLRGATHSLIQVEVGIRGRGVRALCSAHSRCRCLMMQVEVEDWRASRVRASAHAPPPHQRQSWQQ